MKKTTFGAHRSIFSTPLPGFLTKVTACVAFRRSIRKERAEKRSTAYG